MTQAASDKERSESWIETLASAASQLGAGEALAELGTQARELLSEVRRAASEQGTEREPASPSPMDSQDLAGRLDGLSSSLEEVADLLDAGLERLETVEMQLGDPDDSVDARLRSGIESCERRLGGIEHRLAELGRMLTPAEARTAPAPALVLVVDADCRRRCDLCVALEHQGLHTLAAADAATARRMIEQHAPAAIVAADELDEDVIAELESACAPETDLLLRTTQRGASRSTRRDAWVHFAAGDGIAALAASVTGRSARTALEPSPTLPAKTEETSDATD